MIRSKDKSDPASAKSDREPEEVNIQQSQLSVRVIRGVARVILSQANSDHRSAKSERESAEE